MARITRNDLIIVNKLRTQQVIIMRAILLGTMQYVPEWIADLLSGQLKQVSELERKVSLVEKGKRS